MRQIECEQMLSWQRHGVALTICELGNAPLFGAFPDRARSLPREKVARCPRLVLGGATKGLLCAAAGRAQLCPPRRTKSHCIKLIPLPQSHICRTARKCHSPTHAQAVPHPFCTLCSAYRSSCTHISYNHLLHKTLRPSQPRPNYGEEARPHHPVS